MSEQERNRDAGTGRFVSAEYAETNPETTFTDHFTGPIPVDPLDADLARIEELTDSRLTLVGHLAGQSWSNTDPREIARQAREWAEQRAAQLG